MTTENHGKHGGAHHEVEASVFIRGHLCSSVAFLILGIDA